WGRIGSAAPVAGFLAFHCSTELFRPPALPADLIRGPLSASAEAAMALRPAHGSRPWAAAVGGEACGAYGERGGGEGCGLRLALPVQPVAGEALDVAQFG